MQHKEFAVTLILTEDNITNGSTVYEAVEVDNADESSADFSPGSQKNAYIDEMSIINARNTHFCDLYCLLKLCTNV